LPLLLHTGLLKKNGDEKNDFTVMTKKGFVQYMANTSKLDGVTCKLLVKSRQYYICVGKPNFASPNKQVKAISSKKIAHECLICPDKVDKESTKMIVFHVDTLSDVESHHQHHYPYHHPYQHRHH